MYYIYALKCEELVLYVGQTIYMRKRFRVHKSRKGTCSSSDIPDDMDFYMDLLEVVDTIEEATEREQFYYDTLKPFYNKNRPGQTQEESKKEYETNNKKKRLQHMKKYYQEKRKKILAQRKIYGKKEEEE